MLRILDLRYLGCFRIKHGILQQNFSKYYRFEKADFFMQTIQQLYKYIKEGKKRRDKRKISVVRS